ncbi:DUF6234 family protein [Nocardioides sp. R1-1]|uniref:DUF6234 family protein n=1 Tax=Nocardioides sp. R1-1 TaxID=3383502 RepID=UPI0038CF6334
MLRPRTERPRPAGLLEVAASTCAVLLTLATAWHGFGVYFCLGGLCPGPTGGEVLAYRLLVSALGLAVVASLALAVRRRARSALLWHGLVALSAVATALVFAVPSIDLRELREPAPSPPDRGYVPCYSGSGDCLGG